MHPVTAPTVRFLQLAVADLPTDDRATHTRTEWINPLHIESAIGYVTWQELEPMLWLELTLSSGIVRYTPIGPVGTDDLTAATDHAIQRLLTT